MVPFESFEKVMNVALIYFGDEVSQALEAYMNGPRKTAEPAAGHEEALFISLN